MADSVLDGLAAGQSASGVDLGAAEAPVEPALRRKAAAASPRRKPSPQPKAPSLKPRSPKRPPKPADAEAVAEAATLEAAAPETAAEETPAAEAAGRAEEAVAAASGRTSRQLRRQALSRPLITERRAAHRRPPDF